jgi:hypothetical protein
VTCGLFAALAAGAPPVSAYVRYQSPTGCAYGWRSRNVPITGYPQGLAGLDESQIATAATDAALAWSKGSEALASCTDLDLQVTMKTVNDAPPAAKFDHLNNIVFRGDTWCPDPPICSANERMALAITSVFAGTKSGVIFDADIEVNAVDFQWGDLVTTPDQSKQDLQNALTHEMGHFIGLDHTCYSADPMHPRPAPVDNNGNLVPSCAARFLSDAVRSATMFASADPGDTSKRTLEPDDQQAVCDSYPLGMDDPMACPASGSNGCDIARDASAEGALGATRFGVWGGLLLASVASAAWVRARRVRARRRS